ncbi:MAG: sugar transferase [Candidatus Binatia bacterium]|nr:sugar transferase [Candidatus Binatia bacterium]
MPHFKRQILLNAFRFADVAVMAIAFTIGLVASAERMSMDVEQFLAVRVKLSNILLFVGFAIVWHLIFISQDLYRSRRIGLIKVEWWEVTKAVLLGTLLLAAFALLFRMTAIGRTFLVTFFAVVLPATVIMRSGLRFVLGGVRQKGRNLRNALIVGCGPRGARIGRELRSRPDLGYLILGYVDDIAAPECSVHSGKEKLLGTLSEFEEILKTQEVDEVFIGLTVKSYYETIAKIIMLCEQLGVTVRMPAEMFELHLAKSAIDYLDDAAFLTLRPVQENALCLVIKRAIDVVGSAITLVVLTPVFALIAIAVKLDSRGPVFFVQKRVGLNRRKFRALKFRTMATDAEERIKDLEDKNEVRGAAFKMRNDPRVTRVGRILRKLSLDEVPQFFNVLRGDMSLVGPRPLPTRDVERFDEQWQKRRFSVKPGLTCLWQVNGRHNISFEHWMELDLQYIDNWSLKLDFEILMKTIPAVLRGSGAS